MTILIWFKSCKHACSISKAELHCLDERSGTVLFAAESISFASAQITGDFAEKKRHLQKIYWTLLPNLPMPGEEAQARGK